jgi:hypothetical protein
MESFTYTIQRCVTAQKNAYLNIYMHLWTAINNFWVSCHSGILIFLRTVSPCGIIKYVYLKSNLNQGSIYFFGMLLRIPSVEMCGLYFCRLQHQLMAKQEAHLSKGIQQQKSMKYLEQLTNRAVEVAHKT